ncbi:MAG: HEAT repeat domain-containing protein [Planctomycetaceae bacterium]|jgi:HEAT repeat protein
MSSSGDNQPAANSPADSRPEELPPVQPPSAGFIVQLFLVPALIVMAVIAVWAMFGKLADSGADWTQLVAELGSGNEHRQWRSAQELAQLLRNDQISPPTDRPPLSEIPEVADALVNLLTESLNTANPSEEELLQQKFLARALGSLNADEKTLPVLAIALQPTRDLAVRESSLMSVTTILGRRFDRKIGYQTADAGEDNLEIPVRKPLVEGLLGDEQLLKQIQTASQDSEPMLRSLAAYALGNISGPESIDLLRVMLLDGDSRTRANVVMSLARNGVAEAVPELLRILADSMKPFPNDETKFEDESARLRAIAEYEAERPVLARNGLRAALDLWLVTPAEARQDLLNAIQEISDASGLPASVNLQARELQRLLDANKDAG